MLGISNFWFHPQVADKSYVEAIFGPFWSKKMVFCQLGCLEICKDGHGIHTWPCDHTNIVLTHSKTCLDDSLALGDVESADVLTETILNAFPLHVYLIPWHPCIPLPQTHYFVSTHRTLVAASHSMVMIPNGWCNTRFLAFHVKETPENMWFLGQLAV